MLITVLLESFERTKIQGKKGAYTLYCDLATIDDARNLYEFVTNTQIDQIQKLPTGLHIIGLNDDRHLSEDAYYRINLNAGNPKVIIQPNHTTFDSYLIDFTNVSPEFIRQAITYVPYKDIERRLKKAKSTVGATYLKSHFEKISDPNDEEKEYVQVNLVDQGNWNEYHVGKRQIPVVFDLGTKRNASDPECNNLIHKYTPMYASSTIKPIVIISHWDLDHYKCLLQMTTKEIGLFAAFIVVETLPTATAEKAYDLIKATPSVEVFSIPTYGKSKSKVPIDVNNSIQLNKISIYSGIGSNRNTRGLIAVIKNASTAVLLSGDCLWAQLNHVIKNEAISFVSRKCHLVVPHHGSGKDETYIGFVIPSTWTCGEFIISVGKNNIYKHPSRKVTAYLKELFNTKKIFKTMCLSKDYKLKM